MIEFKSYFSGSSGNFNTLSDGKTKIALDFGVTISKAKKAMDFNLSSLGGVLSTHSHFDHCKGLNAAVKCGINCYTTKSTIEKTSISGHRVNEIKPGELFIIGSLKILPFELEHDVPNVGFLIQSDSGKKALYITDTAYCRYKFKGLNLIAIEVNYSKELLDKNIKSGVTPEVIRNRIIKSHFSLSNMKEFLKANDLSQCQAIHLIHLSSTNADPERFKKEIQGITGVPVYV